MHRGTGERGHTYSTRVRHLLKQEQTTDRSPITPVEPDITHVLVRGGGPQRPIIAQAAGCIRAHHERPRFNKQPPFFAQSVTGCVGCPGDSSIDAHIHHPRAAVRNKDTRNESTSSGPTYPPDPRAHRSKNSLFVKEVWPHYPQQEANPAKDRIFETFVEQTGCRI
jgi:hypothetical protein